MPFACDFLCFSEFSPNVKHENGCDEEQWHYEYWNWSTKKIEWKKDVLANRSISLSLFNLHFDSWAVISIESPHSSCISSSSITSWCSWCGGCCFSLFEISTWTWSTSSPAWSCGFWSYICWWCWSRLNCIKNNLIIISHVAWYFRWTLNYLPF